MIEFWVGELLDELVGNKAKGRISKWVFQENKACQIVQKTKIWRALFF